MRRFLIASSLVAVAAGIGASPALAAVQFVYKVGGAELKAGETRGFAIGTQNEYKMLLKISGRLASVKCARISLGTGAEIKGGRPGTKVEKLEFESCTGSVEGMSCTAATAKSSSLSAEIVEGVKAAALYGGHKLELFKAAVSGQPFIEVKLTSCGTLGNFEGTITGNIAAAVEPIGELEVKEVLVRFPEAIVEEVKTAENVSVRPKLEAGGERAYFEGSTYFVIPPFIWNAF